MPKLFIHFLDHDQIAALKAAGHEVLEVERPAVAALWAEFKAKFPDEVAQIQKMIADYRSKDMAGGLKAVAIAEDALPLVPEVIRDLPDAKAFLVHGVTELFAEGEEALSKAALGLVGKL